VQTRTLFITLWGLVWTVLAGWQLYCAATDRPTVGDLLRLLREWWLTRWLLLVGWFWMGWHFFVRGSW
jgi:hypothetical protein